MVLLTNFPPPTEGVQLQQTNTSVDIDGKNLGNGTLFISESCVAWQKDEDGKGFSLLYPAICCHAISRDLNAFPQECLYVMMDGKMPEEDSADEDEEEEDDEESLTEIRFIPADKDMLEPMFAAMSECQALHPDPEDMDSDDEAYSYYDDNEDEELTENGVHATAEGASHATGDTHTQLSHFADVLHLGQGDGPGPSGVAPAAISASGDAWEAEDEDQGMDGQFQDAENME